MPNLSLRSAFDGSVAALAGFSAGFVCFALPAELFASLAERSRIARFVPGAEPPFGDTARLAAALAAAAIAFLFVFALMRLLDRIGGKRAVAETTAPDEAAPRLRRADAHPDAPARAPISAGRDLGEPLELETPLPAFLVPQAEEPEPQPEAPPETAAPPQSLADLAAQLPQPDQAADESLSQLVSRIETGFGRKRQALPAPEAEPEPAEAERPEPEEPVRHRLRSAISDLQKISQAG